MWRSTPTLLAALSSRARRHGGAMVWPPSVGTRLSICTLAQPEERMVYLMSPVHHQYTIIVRKLRQLLTVIPELVQMQVYRMVQLSKKRNRVMISWELTFLKRLIEAF